MNTFSKNVKITSCSECTGRGVNLGRLIKERPCYYTHHTAWKVSVFGVILVRIFPNSNWIRRDTEYLSVFNPNAANSDQNNSEYGHFQCSVIWCIESCRMTVQNIYFIRWLERDCLLRNFPNTFRTAKYHRCARKYF